MSSEVDIKVSILVKKQKVCGKSYYVAQGLEHDIVVQSRRLKDLPEHFGIALCTYIFSALEDGKNPKQKLTELGSAPQEYWNAYNAINKRAKPIDLGANRIAKTISSRRNLRPTGHYKLVPSS